MIKYILLTFWFLKFSFNKEYPYFVALCAHRSIGVLLDAMYAHSKACTESVTFERQRGERCLFTTMLTKWCLKSVPFCRF